MRFAFIHARRGQYPLRVLCRVLGVSEGGYHAWRTRPRLREQHDATLLSRIDQAHQASHGRYGAPRIHAELRAQGLRCSRHRVARLMRQAGLRGKGKRRYRKTTDSDHTQPIAENLVQRVFTVTEPNRVWVSDLTYLWTAEGWLYLAVVLDLHSRRVVGWAMGSRLTTDLPLSALFMAHHQRRPPPGLILHSDRGSQYASHAYQRALSSMGMTCSMSKKGDCYDNAVAESFFATLKRELVEGHPFETRPHAQSAVFAYIEGFYNRTRRHSSLGYLSPADFEAAGLVRKNRVA